MQHTTDIRTITARDIALDPISGCGPRLLANILAVEHDGSLRLEVLGHANRVFFKDGALTNRSQKNQSHLADHKIVWQGRLPGNRAQDIPAGLAKVAKAIARNENGLVAYDDMPVCVKRGTLRDIANMLSARNELDQITRDMIADALKLAA